MPNSENDHAAGGGTAPAAPPPPPAQPPAPPPSLAKPQAKVKTVVAKLRCLSHRGETVNTRWGDVSFDQDGLAELEMPEKELPMLRNMRPFSWLAEDHTSYQQQLRQRR